MDLNCTENITCLPLYFDLKRRLSGSLHEEYTVYRKVIYHNSLIFNMPN